MKRQQMEKYVELFSILYREYQRRYNDDVESTNIPKFLRRMDEIQEELEQGAQFDDDSMDS